MINFGGALVADLLLPFSQMDAMTTWPMLVYTLLALFVGYVLYEQAIYALARRRAKGPDSPGLPLLGRIVSSPSISASHVRWRTRIPSSSQ